MSLRTTTPRTTTIRTRTRRVWAATLVASLGLTGLLVAPAQASGSTPAPASAPAPAEVTITESVSPEGFTHPGIGVSADSLRTAREMVQADVEPWASYYDAMVQSTLAARDFRPANAGAQEDQPQNAAFDSQGVQSRLIRDAFGAYTQAVLYVITADPVYRENALRAVRTWSHMDPERYAYYPDAHIHSGVPLYRMVAAAEILRATSVEPGYEGYDLEWHDVDTQNLTDNLVVPMTETFLHTNWRYMNQHSYPLTGATAGYIFTDDADRYAEAVEWYTVNATTDRPEQNGSVAGLFPRIDQDDPLNPYGYSFVQHQEMGRDQAHAWDGINTLGSLARFLTVQGTTVDPATGTISDAPDAVSPYDLFDRRLLDAAETFTAYMLGHEIPWIDTRGGPGSLSEAYRGRMFNPIDELYTVYRDRGVDMATEAPRLTELHESADGPVFYWGTTLHSFWDSNPDYSPEYWLSLPPDVAGETRPQAQDAQVRLATRSSAMDDRSSIVTEDGAQHVRMPATPEGTTIAARTLMYTQRQGWSPVGVRFRTDGPATLEVGAPDRDLVVVPLPDTAGEWRYATYDVDLAKVPRGLGGENLAYLTVRGDSGAQVDLDSVELEAATRLTIPRFEEARPDPVGIVGVGLSLDVSATDGAGEVLTYSALGLPAGATLDPQTGVLGWMPGADQTGTHEVTVVADDGTTVSSTTVNLRVAADRAGAVDEVRRGYDPALAYVSGTLSAFSEVEAEVLGLVGEASDDDFSAALARLQEATSALELLDPLLADGTLDLAEVAAADPATVQLRSLTDGSFHTTTGDLRAPLTLDLGEGFRFTADAIGLQARYDFANRSEGANAYGSDDGQTWTLLTSRPTTNTTDEDYAMETIPVREEVRGTSFRYLQVQVDAPGVPTDPAYPGISSFSEVRIHGQRLEAASTLTSVSIGSSNPDPGLAQDGDTVTLEVVSEEPLAELTATVEGVVGTGTSTDGLTWQVQVLLPAGGDYGRDVRFAVDYLTAGGARGATTTTTTDGSRLALWDSTLVEVPVAQDQVDASTLAWPGTGTSADHAWRLFDGDVSTFTDATSANGWVTVTAPPGEQVELDLVRVHPRASHVARSNGTLVQGSADGGQTWQTLVEVTGVSQARWYTFELAGRAAFPLVRVLDEHGGHLNLAEVQLLRRDVGAADPTVGDH
jgi:hypothetical protein